LTAPQTAFLEVCEKQRSNQVYNLKLISYAKAGNLKLISVPGFGIMFSMLGIVCLCLVQAFNRDIYIITLFG